jgi:hypothetical protein
MTDEDSDTDGAPVAACWCGPFNLRAMVNDLPVTKRTLIRESIQSDKMNYARIINFAIRADGRRSRRAVIDHTSFALGRPLEAANAASLFDALLESGWVTEGGSATVSQEG